MIRLSAMRLSAGAALLQGDAVIGLTTGATSLALRGHDIDLTPVARLLDDRRAWNGRIKLRVRLVDAKLGGFAFGDLTAALGIAPDGTAIRAFSASLPGLGRLGLTGAIGPHGLRGTFNLIDRAPPALFKAAALAVPALAGLPSLDGPLHLAGSIDVPHSWKVVRLGGLHGGIGPDRLETAVLSAGRVVAKLIEVNKTQRLQIAASLGFARLDATPLLDLTRSDVRPAGLRLELALTAWRARLGGVEARRLLLDAKLGRRVNVRAFEFHAVTPQGRPAALVALRGARAAGMISDVNLLVAGPDAARALDLLPQNVTPRLPSKAMMRAPFAVGADASGPVAALASKVSVNLGDLRIRGAPKVDLVNHTAGGAVSLRMPDAIALAKLWDKQAGLAWPGAGSVGLRTDFTYAPKHLGLSNFVLSFGALTASGRLALKYGSSPFRVSGVMNADRLALPPANALLRLANAPGRLVLQLPDITAAHVLLGGVDVADDALASLTVMPQAITLQILQAKLAGGALTGYAVLHSADETKPPSVKAELKLTGANAAALASAFTADEFPPVISAGRFTAALNGQASGYTAKTWIATLDGTLIASGKNLTVQGIGLTGAAALMNSITTTPKAAKLRQALLSGTTDFTAMRLNGDFASGAFTISNAKLTGDAGSVALSGTIDVPDRSLAVTASLQPVSPGDQPSPNYKVTLSGPWAKLKRSLDATQGMAAQATLP